ncbi:MAG: hypothetical protein ACRDY0_01010 [Acidimicrobiales bacterium]
MGHTVGQQATSYDSAVTHAAVSLIALGSAAAGAVVGLLAPSSGAGTKP